MKAPRSTYLAFSLFELLIVMFITSVILFCVAGLTSRTFRTLRFLQEKSRTLESATLGCERLASELREAVAITVPIPAGQVEFRKVRPSAPEAAGNDWQDFTIPAGAWSRNYASDASGVNQLAPVRYGVHGATSELQRTAAGQTTVVATDVNSFVVAPVAGATGSYSVRLALQEESRVIVFETVTTCPALQLDYAP
jgi:Tfp pilus assembly protein PilW